MIKITIEGPIGAGKSRIKGVIHAYYKSIGLRSIDSENITAAALKAHKPDVLIIEKQVSDAR